MGVTKILYRERLTSAKNSIRDRDINKSGADKWMYDPLYLVKWTRNLEGPSSGYPLISAGPPACPLSFLDHGHFLPKWFE
jgi:hypothetical protein